MAHPWTSSTHPMWTNSTSAAELTSENIEAVYASVQERPGRLFTGSNNPIYLYDEAEDEITVPEPPCEDLGEFLLMKYNKRKVVAV